MANTLLQPGPTRVVPSLTARLRKGVRDTCGANFNATNKNRSRSEMKDKRHE